jgi:flagellar basal body-associated protein FliL
LLLVVVVVVLVVLVMVVLVVVVVINLSNMPGKHEIKEQQKTVRLGTAHILG